MPPRKKETKTKKANQSASSGTSKAGRKSTGKTPAKKSEKSVPASKKSKKSPVKVRKGVSEKAGTEKLLYDPGNLLNHIFVAVISTDANFRIKSWNRAAELMYGYSQEEVLGKPAFEVLKNLYIDQIYKEVIKNFLETGSWVGEVIQEKKDGTPINIQAAVSILKDDAGNQIGAVAVHRDITELRSGEEALKESEERYRALFDRSKECILIYDFGGNFIDANPAALELLGYSRKEFSFLNFGSLLEENQRRKEKEITREIIKTASIRKGITEYKLRHKNGDYVYIETKTSLLNKDGKPYAVQGIARDITARRRAEEALRESEERYRLLAENSRDVIWMADKNFRITYISQSIEKVRGFTQQEMIGRTIDDIATPGSINKAREYILERLEKGEQGDEEALHSGFLEIEVYKKDGSTTWIEVAGTAIRNEEGKLVGVQGINRDITERKHAENALQESERRYRSFMQNFQGIAFRGDMNFIPQFFHGAVEEITGYTAEEILAGNPRWDEIVYPEDLPEIMDKTKEVRSKPNFKAELVHRIIRKDGEIRWVRERGHNICDDSGKLEYVDGVIYDITERVHTEELMRLQRDLGIDLGTTSDLIEALAIILEVALRIKDIDCGGVYLVDDDTGELNLVVNKGLSTDFIAEVAHFNADAPNTRLIMKGEPVYNDYKEVVSPVTETKMGEGLRALAVIPVKHKGKVIASFNLASHKYDVISQNARNAMEAISAQIEEVIVRIKSEEALRDKTEFLDSVIHSTYEGIFVLDKNANYVFINPGATRIMKYGREDWIGKRSGTGIHPEDVKSAMSGFFKALSGEENQYEARIKAKDGVYRLLNISLAPLAYEGKPHVLGVVTDITDRKQAEEALKESEKRFRLLSESSPMGAFQTDNEGRVLFTNKHWQEITEMSLEESLGFGWASALHDDDKERIIKEWEEVLRNEKEYAGEFRFVRPSGEVRWVHTRTAPIRMDTGEVIGHVGANEDITDRKRMEEELQKADKLESVGLLAGGIAHDFNNILTSLWGNIQLAMVEMEPETNNYKLLTESEKACKRATDLTRQLLTFSRGGAPLKSTTSLVTLIEDSTAFALRGSNVKCKHSISKDLRMVEVDEGQIAQVVNNLIINAKQAMPEGGDITVSAENIILDSKAVLPLNEGEYVIISIEDCGTGIKEEHLSKIFDPYFSTKQTGSGLGLATCYSIIRNHDGHIEAKSDLGEGTTFVIYLPASNKQLALEEKEAEKLPKGHGKILVMDDEEHVRDLAENILSYIGYNVELAKDGAEAIQIYKNAADSGEPCDAVILDLTVPGGMGGKRCMEKLLEINPKIKAIVSSGYSSDPVLANFRDYGFCGIIAKPYKIEDIGKQLHQMLVKKTDTSTSDD